ITDINAPNGTLYLDANGDGIYDSGEEVSKGDTFTADQLEHLYFKQDGTEPDGTNPSFDIKVTDNGGGETNQNGEPINRASVTEHVEITVKPNDDNPVLETNAGKDSGVKVA